MQKYLAETLQYWQIKIVAGIATAVFTESFFQLLVIFALLELLDTATRWLALSMQCYKAIYPQSKCTITTGIGFIWQARKWRYINSLGMRTGVDKVLMYLLLLLTGAVTDYAFSLVHTPRLLSSVIVVFLASTEALSILENLSQCNGTIQKIKERFQEKCNL